MSNCQNGLNNCKENASQSPVRRLVVSTEYTDMICATHWSVVALPVIFYPCGGQQSGFCMVQYEKNLLAQWRPRLLTKVCVLEMRKKKDVACYFSLEPRVSSFSFCFPAVSAAGLYSFHLSLSSNSSNSCRDFSHFTMSPSQESAIAVSGAERTGPSLGHRWSACLVWHLLPRASEGQLMWNHSDSLALWCVLQRF